jgi:hypothetical protein
MTNQQKPSPGDNRGADDVDGNTSGGATKTRGVRNPEQPPRQDRSEDKTNEKGDQRLNR